MTILQHLHRFANNNCVFVKFFIVHITTRYCHQLFRYNTQVEDSRKLQEILLTEPLERNKNDEEDSPTNA